MLAAAKYIGAGVACSGLKVAGAGIGTFTFLKSFFYKFYFYLRSSIFSLSSRTFYFSILSFSRGIIPLTDITSNLTNSTEASATATLIATATAIGEVHQPDDPKSTLIVGGVFFLLAVVLTLYTVYLGPCLDRLGVSTQDLEPQRERGLEAGVQAIEMNPMERRPNIEIDNPTNNNLAEANAETISSPGVPVSNTSADSVEPSQISTEPQSNTLTNATVEPAKNFIEIIIKYISD
jgi:hypothetical protein